MQLNKTALVSWFCVLSLALVSCRTISTGDVVSVATNPSSAADVLKRKAISAATQPQNVIADLKDFHATIKAIFDALEKAAGGKWGKKETRVPRPKTYVKYTQNYKARALVDFDRGEITVETVDTKDPTKSLRQAVIVTLLTPADPRGVDLFSAKPVTLGAEPYLYKEVLDHEKQPVRWQWRAERYANHLLRTARTKRTITVDDNRTTVHSVRFSMVRDHGEIRARKYLPLARKQAARFNISLNLVMAIMKVESDFNPYATSSAGAFGLMQVVPATAGEDVHKFLTGKKGQPSASFLFKPENAILYGTAYLHLLDTRFLSCVENAVSREYCMISGYNGGAGGALRTFHKDRGTACKRINALSPQAVYHALYTKHRYAETRRYLWKVNTARKQYVGL